MPKFVNHVRLSEGDRSSLLMMISKGAAPAKMILRANILLATDENSQQGRVNETEIAMRFHVSRQTVHNVRQQFFEKGLEATVGRKKRDKPPIPAKITGDVEARIIAMSCNEPPPGRGKWTLRLLAEKVIELQIVDSISYVSVGQVLKKTNSNRI